MRGLPSNATPNLGLSPAATSTRVLLVCGEDPETLNWVTNSIKIVTQPVAHHREFHTSSCTFRGNSFTLCLTGIGSASVEIALSELYQTGGRTFIHTGTAASLHASVLPVGAAVVVASARRDDGASLHYTPGVGQEVSGHPQALEALTAAATSLRHHVLRASAVSSDAFYGCGAIQRNGALEHGSLLPLGDDRPPVSFEAWLMPIVRSTEPRCLDMEVATFYMLASLIKPEQGVRWGSIKAISNTIPFVHGEQNEQTEKALRVAVEIAATALTRL
jgi:uridine phosphorylase